MSCFHFPQDYLRRERYFVYHIGVLQPSRQDSLFTSTEKYLKVEVQDSNINRPDTILWDRPETVLQDGPRTVTKDAS